MILSVSRRTDIPAFFSEWFYGRIKAGEVFVRNPTNINQVSRIDISPKVTDCIVFWTKNPRPMLGSLDLLKDYSYYFQYTVNAYDKDAEPNVPSLDERLDTFCRLSDKIGKERVIWRYDPIFISERYDLDFHVKSMEYIAERLSGKTEKCVFSFVDIYRQKNMKSMLEKKFRGISDEELEPFIERICPIAEKNGIKLATCAEKVDLEKYGIMHNSCIDGDLIERIVGYSIKKSADGEREFCGCVKCHDIGSYDTCPHGCVYCYANYKPEMLKRKLAMYDPSSPMLCDSIDPEKDKVNNREVKLLKDNKAAPSSFDQLKF